MENHQAIDPSRSLLNETKKYTGTESEKHRKFIQQIIENSKEQEKRRKESINQLIKKQRDLLKSFVIVDDENVSEKR